MSKKLPCKTLTFLIVGIASLCLILFFRQIQEFLLELIAAFQSIETTREYIAGYGLFAPLVSAIPMIFQSVIAPLPAFLITIANRAIFGFWWGCCYREAVRCSVLSSASTLPVFSAQNMLHESSVNQLLTKPISSSKIQ